MKFFTVKGENYCSKTYRIKKNDRLKMLEISKINDTSCVVLFKSASASRRVKISVKNVDYRFTENQKILLFNVLKMLFFIYL